MDERIDEVVQEIEEEQALGRVSAVKVFRSMLNQPNLIAVSSADGVQEGANDTPLSQSSFYNFTCNLPRPCLDVDSIQLIGANIPQANANIPNTACAFWYYKMSAYSGQIPNINNLYYNRLLPSIYKQELVDAPTTYGWNRTFKNYKDLATELAKMGKKDLCWYNWNATLGAEHPTDYIPFIPNDVSITLNTQINKFQMKGNNVFTTPTYIDWSGGTTYAKGKQVVYLGKSYKSLQNANSSHTPSSSPLWWELDYNEVVAKWDAFTNYGETRYVTDGTTLYVSTYPNASQNPNGDYTWSALQHYTRYQVVLDPTNATYYTYISPIPRTNNQPSNLGSQGWLETNYDIYQAYPEGFICFVDGGGQYYVALRQTTGDLPTGDSGAWQEISFWTAVDLTANNVWNRYLVAGYQDPNVAVAQGKEFEYEWNAYNLYEKDAIIIYDGNTSKIPLWKQTATYDIGSYVRWKSVDSSKEVIWVINGTMNNTPPPGQLKDGTTNVWDLVHYQAVSQNLNSPPPMLWLYERIFYEGDVVIFNNKTYVALIINQRLQPDIYGNYWAEIRTSWKSTIASPTSAGLYYLTSVYDMYSADAGLEYFFTFPEQIGGQPYVDVPKRLLNSILGFTWNGVFSTGNIQPFQLDPFAITYSVSSTPQTNFLNRFRPIPIYELLPQWDINVTYDGGDFVAYNGLPYGSADDNNLAHLPTDTEWWEQISPNPLTLGASVINDTSALAEVYTADAYACLVYSSIVYIYTSIAGASSLDTSRNTNLLAITPMNAGNLGVAFSNQFIDNPLNKVAGDIYNIYLELRDEFGEPYLLSNNAVASFMLKVRYVEENKPRENT